jgi:hypothetical protein
MGAEENPTEDENVIQVYKDELVKKVAQHVINQGLENVWSRPNGMTRYS